MFAISSTGIRIKELRKELTQKYNVNYTQEKFAERIGAKKTTISGYESGRREPSEQTILCIVREFDINEHWLRTGEGPIFETLTPKQNRANNIGALLSDDALPEKVEFFDRMYNLPDEFFIMLAKAFNKSE